MHHLSRQYGQGKRLYILQLFLLAILEHRHYWFQLRWFLQDSFWSNHHFTQSATINTSTDVTSLYAVDGSSNPTKTTCVNAYPDSLNLRCIPCGSGMFYSTTLSACQCSAANTYALNGQCYSSTATFKYTNASGSDYIAEQHVRESLLRQE